jgi:hypothetical protein
LTFTFAFGAGRGDATGDGAGLCGSTAAFEIGAEPGTVPGTVDGKDLAIDTLPWRPTCTLDAGESDESATAARGDASSAPTGNAARAEVGDTEAETERDGGGDTAPARACASWKIEMLPWRFTLTFA